MADEGPKYRTEEELRKRVAEAFSSNDQLCKSLCRDKRKSVRQLALMELNQAPEAEIEEVIARIDAINKRRESLGCTDICQTIL
jgi:hypothetical protein